jgi:RNA polymerase sigma-70 factor (ECF subfamily)
MSQCVEKTVQPLSRDEFAAIVARAVSVPGVEAAAQSDDSADSTTSLSPLDDDSRAWVSALQSDGAPRDQAVARLHELLLKAARFEVSRRRASAPHLRGDDFDDLAMQAADDALVAVLKKLDTFRGDSRFTTWVYKFALLEAAVKVRRRAWQGRELPLAPETWDVLPAKSRSPEAGAEETELMAALREGIEHALTAHQREVLVAITITGVPIDVLSERLNTTRGALYKTLHDARRKLRDHLAAQGLDVPGGDGR